MLIRHATLVDGTGRAGRPADVLVENATIQAVPDPGAIPERAAVSTLDATDSRSRRASSTSTARRQRTVPPGTTRRRSIRGQPTEVVGGNAGSILAPWVPGTTDARPLKLRRISPSCSSTWSSASVNTSTRPDSHGYVTNHRAALVGTTCCAMGVLGMADVAADADATAEMGIPTRCARRRGIRPRRPDSPTPRCVLGGRRSLPSPPPGLAWAAHVRTSEASPASCSRARRKHWRGTNARRPVQISHLEMRGPAAVRGRCRRRWSPDQAPGRDGVEVRQTFTPIIEVEHDAHR
ncbi:hypothetical protein HBB16_20180 [Pseudonocardia sp. MCCB 268]|nr:hypothetical protein [Pseudonocardia cytotoxica]